MKDNKKYIDDLFKDKLGDHAETPPPAVWKALEKRLPGALPFAKVRPSLKSLPWHAHLLIVSTAVTIGGGATYTVVHHINHHKKHPTTHTAVNIATINASPDSINSTKIVNDTASLMNAETAAANSTTTVSNDTSSLHNAGQTTTASYVAAYNALQQKNKNNTDTDESTPSNNAAVTAEEKQNAIQQNINKKEAPASNKAVANNNNSTVNSTVTNDTKTATGKTVKKTRKNNRLLHSAKHSSSKQSKATTAGQVNSSSPIVNDSNNNAHTTTSVANNYSSGTTPEKEIIPASNSGNLDVAKGQLQLAGTFKDQVIDAHSPTTTDAMQNEPAVKIGNIRKPTRIELGIKAGYEGGTSNNAAQKIVVSPYIQYNLSSKLSLMLQPAIKFAHLNSQNLSGPSFYKENSDSSAKIYTTPIPQTEDTFVNVNVVYSQTHDSIVKSYTINGSYKQFELPILLKYALSKNIAAYGGFTLSYSTYTSIVEHTYTSAPILKTDTVNAGIQEVPVNIAVKPVSTQITYSGNPLSDYTAPVFSSRSGGLFNLGYMLGFSYTYSNRWLLDVLLQQSAAKTFVVGQYNTNATYSAPYFRITLGYRILK